MYRCKHPSATIFAVCAHILSLRTRYGVGTRNSGDRISDLCVLRGCCEMSSPVTTCVKCCLGIVQISYSSMGVCTLLYFTLRQWIFHWSNQPALLPVEEVAQLVWTLASVRSLSIEVHRRTRNLVPLKSLC